MSLPAWILFCFLLSIRKVYGASFTFELPDGESRCFYNSLNKREAFKIEFQVISGGNYDVDVVMKDPNNHIIKSFQREQYNYFTIDISISGDYELCFSNEFSSFTHKIIFMSWETPSDLEKQADVDSPSAPLTMMDSTIYTVYENLEKASAYQTKNRVQESSSRSFVEALNDRVTYGSIIQAILIIVVALGQVYLLRSLFKEPSISSYRRRINPASAVDNAGY